MIEMSDKQLVEQCLKGNTEAFEQLINKYQKTIFNTVYRMVSDFQDAEDITQSVFVKVYENLNRFNPKYKFFSWIYRMTMNETLNFLKQKRPDQGLDHNFISTDHNPETEVEESELSENIQKALMLLKAEYREVIVLKHFQGFSYKEIAVMLNLPEKTVKSRLFSARQMLKENLIKQGIMSND